MSSFKFIFDLPTNQLLGTYISSSIAIVSIVGGFIITLMLNLSSQRQGIKSKLNTIKNSIDFKSKEIKEIKDELGQAVVKNWVFDIYSNMSEKEETFDRLLKEEATYSLTRDELKLHYNKLYKSIEEFKDSFINNLEEYPEEFNEYIRRNNKDVSNSNYEIWRDLYDYKIYLMKKEEWKKRQGDPLKNGWNAGVFTMTDPSLNASLGNSNLINLEDQLNSLLSKKRLLKSQKENLKNELSKLDKPKGLNQGVSLLFYFTLSGVLYPIIIKFYNLNNNYHELISFVLFVFGLLLFLFYIIWLLFNISGIND